jgi:hypothetical protein
MTPIFAGAPLLLIGRVPFVEGITAARRGRGVFGEIENIRAHQRLAPR